jgi:hypothetical protein
MKLTTYNEWLNENQSPMNEGSSDPRVKKEAISRLSDFFRVPASNLSSFNFDGKDNIKALTKALNSTSDEGTAMYYKTAIKLAMEEVGVHESVNESSEIVLQKLSDIDHTRVIKWLASTFNSNEYEIRKKGSTDYVIDTKKLDKKISYYLLSLASNLILLIPT